MHSPPEVIFMFPQGGAAEAPNDKVMIRVFPGFLDGHVSEYTAARPQDVVCPVLHLPPHPNHSSCSPVTSPGASAPNKVFRYIL